MNLITFESIQGRPWLLALIAAWSLAWKGVALWKAARRKEKGWFIALLVVNTMALLEIIYIFAVARDKKAGEKGSIKLEVKPEEKSESEEKSEEKAGL
ncbi:MAG: DUF5652 family protein [Patescibacteria group bacterium]|jgi:hypothetical protein